jgi:hypothetical protein
MFQGRRGNVFRRVAFAALVEAVLASGNDARAADATATTGDVAIDGHTLRINETGAVVDLGCQGRASLRVGTKVFVACGPDGVVEIDVSNPVAPRRAGQMSVGGEATALFEREGRAWVEIAHVEARPVTTEATAATAGPAPVAPAPPMQYVPPPAAAPSRPSLIAPPRRAGLWELSAWAGGFVNLGPLGGGAAGWASAVYRFEAPVVVRFELAPAGFTVGHSATNTYGTNFGSSSTDNAGRFKAVGAAHALVGVDTQFVEVAVGGGISTISNDYLYGPSGSTYVNGTANSGPSIVEEARFGARDGLAVNVESNTVAANDKFQLGFFTGSIQVPLTRSAMLMVRGGGGNMGLLFGDVGARVVVQGDGGPETMALSGYFGGAGINFVSCAPGNTGTDCETFSLGGPSIGGGIEYRR